MRCLRKARFNLPRTKNLLRGLRLPKGKQKRSSTEGSGPEVTPDYHTKVPTWNPPLELDRALLPTDSSIRDFQ